MIESTPQPPLPAPAHRWAVVSLLLGAATLCGFGLEKHVSLTSLAMVYVLAVVIAAYTLDWIGSSVCAVGAVTALNFFFVPPRWTFEVESQEHFIALVAMLVVALVISHLATGGPARDRHCRLNERRARQLQTLATDLPMPPRHDDVLALGRAALDAAFAGPCSLVLTQDGADWKPPDHIDAIAVRDGLRCCITEAAVLGPGTGRWPGLDAWYLPLGDKGHIHGAACVMPASPDDANGREHAQALCTLLAQALWRLRLNAEVLRAHQEAQHQQLQSTFLAAISHDLRTPLAAIVGAASSLQTQRAKLGACEQDRLLGSIVSEAAYLSTVTENTLQLVRLTSPAQALRRDWESLEEIIGAVLARVRQRDPGSPHQVQGARSPAAGESRPRAAGTTDRQPAGQRTEVQRWARLRAERERPRPRTGGERQGPRPGPERCPCRPCLFAPHVRGDHPGVRGAGLGLAVCKAIAEAHGARLTHRHRSAAGAAVFRCCCPWKARSRTGRLS
jgi:two-component system sensor histidine kinase KdpD